MKIGFLTPEYPHPKTGGSGGIGTSIMNLSQGLVQLGHEVAILVYGQDKDEVFEAGGIIFHKIKNIKIKGLSKFLTQKKIENYINVLIRKHQIDIVEAADWTGITSFIQPKCPLIVKLHGSDTYFCHLDKRRVKWINRFHEKRALQKATALVSVSRYTAEVTKKIFNLERKFIVIPNGVDVEKFDPNTGDVAVQENTILYFGTLIRKKGLFELPLIFNAIFEKNKNAKLILAGKDSSDIFTGNASVWKMIRPLFNPDAFKNVTYAGSMPYDAIRNMISQASICIFPTFAEALPVSWIEAMAMQKPVVASNIGWAAEIIDDGIDGFLVHPQHHLEYAAKISGLLESPGLQKQLGTQARKKVLEKFSIQVVANENLVFYKKILS